MATISKGSIAELSIDSRLLAERLMNLEVGETISYVELSAIIRRNVQKEAGVNLRTARRLIMREHRIIIGTIRSEGVKRLDDLGAMKSGEQSLGKIHREAKRGAEKLACVTFENLSNEEKTKHLTTSAAIGALFTITKTSSLKKLEKATGESKQSLPLTATLEAFVK